MTPLHLLALHDSAALGVSPLTLGVAIAGILTVAIVLPQRAEEPRVALPEPDLRRPGPEGTAAAQRADGAAGEDATLEAVGHPSTDDAADTDDPADADDADDVDDADEAADADEGGPVGGRVRAGGVVLAVLLVALGVVGLFGLDDPNLASLAVANVVLPAAVLGGLLGGGPRRGPVAPASAVHPLTWVLRVPVVLTHPAGSAGGTVAGLVLLGYAAVSLVGRARVGPRWWADGDPLGVLVALVRRVSPLARDASGARRPWLAALWDPLSRTEPAASGAPHASCRCGSTWWPASRSRCVASRRWP